MNGTNIKLTQKKLAKQRKRADLPDISFDLDGDGYISVNDFFFAKQFDKDKDGKLNEKELAEAKSALSKGYKNRFLLGLERSGPIKS